MVRLLDCHAGTISWTIHCETAAIAAAPGNVKTQAMRMFPATPRRITQGRFAAPARRTAEVMACVGAIIVATSPRLTRPPRSAALIYGDTSAPCEAIPGGPEVKASLSPRRAAGEPSAEERRGSTVRETPITAAYPSGTADP